MRPISSPNYDFISVTYPSDYRNLEPIRKLTVTTGRDGSLTDALKFDIRKRVMRKMILRRSLKEEIKIYLNSPVTKLDLKTFSLPIPYLSAIDFTTLSTQSGASGQTYIFSINISIGILM